MSKILRLINVVHWIKLCPRPLLFSQSLPGCCHDCGCAPGHVLEQEWGFCRHPDQCVTTVIRRHENSGRPVERCAGLSELVSCERWCIGSNQQNLPMMSQ